MRMKKVTAAFLYAASLFLMLFYLFTLYEALHPETTHEYRNYYITQTARKWSGNSAYEYELGTPVLFNSANEETCHRMGGGWSWMEETHCWTDGASSELYFEGLPEQDLNLYIHVLLFRSGAYSANIYVNDTFVGEMGPQIMLNGEFCFKIPSDCLDDGYAQVRIDHNNPEATEEDYRLLGAQVAWVKIDDC